MKVCPIINLECCCCKKNVEDIHDAITPVYKKSKDKSKNKINNESLREPISLSMDSTTESSIDYLNQSPIHNKIAISTDHLQIKKYKSDYDNFYTCEYVYNNVTTHLNNKTIIFDHYRQDDNKLPIKGWFHRCLHCNTITGNSEYYGNYQKYTIYIQSCRQCVYRHIHMNKKKSIYVTKDIQNVLQDMNHKMFFI